MSDINKLDSISKLLDNLQETIEADLKKGAISKIADTTKEAVKERITAGLGVSVNNGTEKPFKKLKDSTIRRRERLQKKGRLSSKTSPETSNQTESGEMVREIKAIKSGLNITIKPSASREDVAQKQEEMGRPSFNLSKKEIDKIEEVVEKTVDSVINKLLKTLK